MDLAWYRDLPTSIEILSFEEADTRSLLELARSSNRSLLAKIKVIEIQRRTGASDEGIDNWIVGIHKLLVGVQLKVEKSRASYSYYLGLESGGDKAFMSRIPLPFNNQPYRSESPTPSTTNSNQTNNMSNLSYKQQQSSSSSSGSQSGLPPRSGSSASNSNPTSARNVNLESVYSSNNLNQSTSQNNLTSSEGVLTETRKRQGKKDEAIRKKIENELARKRPGTISTSSPHPGSPHPSKRSNNNSRSNASKPKQGTVSALKPLPALTVPSSISVADASQLCAAKRTDCVLVVDEEEHLCGIFTAKDLAFRVIGDGLDPRTTPVSAIMTPNPMVTRDTTSATEALQTMVTKGFRHLPVCNEDGDVVGLLDITKVFNESLEKLEKAHGSSQKLYSAMEGAQEQFGSDPGGPINPLMAYVQALRDKMSFPDLGSILDARTAPATVGVRTTVREAARLMRERRTTAVCVMESDGKKIAGIFTSKDVVLRVIAAGIDAKTCSVVRVMTPHPDVGLPSLSIQDALRKMHDGRFLNLPVVDNSGALVGIVDVLKLTYATLEQINSMGGEGSGDAAGGPLWGRFFNAIGGTDDGDNDSLVSGQDASEMLPPSTPNTRNRRLDSFETPGSELFPSDSASVVYEDDRDTSEIGSRRAGGNGAYSAVPPPDVDDGTYLFKFTAPGGTIHRFQARYDSVEFIIDIIGGKLLADPFFSQDSSPLSTLPTDDSSTPLPTTSPLVDPKDFQLSYLDDDGDLVLMTGDRDVLDAVSTARKQGKDRVVVQLKGGRSWESEFERKRVAAKALKNASGSDSKGRKASLTSVEEDGDEEEQEVQPKRKNSKVAVVEQDLVFGFLQKDHLLPAAVAFLAVAIVGVFAASKATNK